MRTARQSGGYDFGRTWITPERASQILEKNVHNRSVNNRAVARLAAAIRAGEWRFNAQPIQLTADGTVLDGQHRLMACIAAGVAIECLVVWDALPETQETMDMGKARTVSDIFKLRGYNNHHAVAALGRRLALAKQFGPRTGATQTNREVSTGAVIQAIEELQNLPRYTVEARQICKTCNFTAGQVGFLMWWFDSIDEVDSAFFWDRLRSGEGLYEGYPIYALRRLGMNRVTSGIGTHFHQYQTAALIIKAWNKFRRGEATYRLNFQAGGANPEAFPEPV
jgi:hypothetical protein